MFACWRKYASLARDGVLGLERARDPIPTASERPPSGRKVLHM